MALLDRLPPFRTALPWALLAVSLALNVAVLAGAWRAGHFGDNHPRLRDTALERHGDRPSLSGGPAGGPGSPPPPFIRALERDLALTEPQRRALRQMHERTGPLFRATNDANRRSSEAYWQELAQAQPDRDRLAALLGEIRDSRHRAAVEQMEAALSFAAQLTDEQRRRFAEAMVRLQSRPPRGKEGAERRQEGAPR